MKPDGQTTWYFPDAEMPPEGPFELKGHESIIILNPNDQNADISFTLYFVDREPVGPLTATVGANRVRCFRTNEVEDFAGYAIPREVQYAIKVQSNTPVIAQYGRLDPRDQPMAFYTNTGYSC